MDKLHIIALMFAVAAVILSAIAFHKQKKENFASSTKPRKALKKAKRTPMALKAKKENFYAESAPKKSVVPIIIGVVFFVILMAIYLSPVKYGTMSFPAFSF